MGTLIPAATATRTKIKMSVNWIQKNRNLLWGMGYEIRGLEHNRRFRENIWKKQDLLYHLWNNYQEPEDIFEAWSHVAKFQTKLTKDRRKALLECPDSGPPEYFHLSMQSSFVKEIGGANWALNWKLEESENEEAGYNIPVQYNNCIEIENFEDLVFMDDMFLTLLNILQNNKHLSKLQMPQLFKLVLDDRYDYDYLNDYNVDFTMLELRQCWNWNSIKKDRENRDMVFRMMVDIVTIKKLEKNTEKQHKRIIRLHRGSQLMTIERITDRLIEIKELLKYFYIEIDVERFTSQRDGRHFDETKLLERLFSIVRILRDLEQTRAAEHYIEEHGPIMDGWTLLKIVKYVIEIQN